MPGDSNSSPTREAVPAANERETRVRALCKRNLILHRALEPLAWLERMARSPYAALPADVYAAGGAVGELERRIAELLGKPAALFFSKGVIAQQVALRVWLAPPRVPTVVVDARSHLQLDEANALERLSGLTVVPIASAAGITVADLEVIAEPIGAVAVELPLRRAGFQLPTWDELAALSAWCRARDIPLHIDGARLWESGPWFGRSYAEIASLADSIYVSLYKGLSAPYGALLLGDSDFIARTQPWRVRYGGTPLRNFYAAIGGLDGLDAHLPKMADYKARAVELAAALKAAGHAVTPDPPRSNGFHLFVAAEPKLLEAAHLDVAEATCCWYFGSFAATPVPGFTRLEVMIGDAAEDFTNAEVVDALSRMIALERRHFTLNRDAALSR